MKTLILGMGNDLLADDAVGLRVARRLSQADLDPSVEVKETSLASLELLDLLAGYDRAILVDAVRTKAGKAGDVYVLSPDDLGGGETPASLHHVDLAMVLALGKQLGVKMPDDVCVLAVEAGDVSTFGGQCSPEVEAAIPKVIGRITAELLRG